MTQEDQVRKTPKRCVVVQHLLFEDLGSFAPVLIGHGFAIEYFQAGGMLPTPAACCAADLVIFLGGPIGVNDSGDYPFLIDELALVQSVMDAGVPLIGICLGAQFIARVLGADVYAGQGKEIGWGPVALSEAGRSSALRHLEGVDVLHWHGETFDLPPGATLLASTDATPHQAFAVGNSVLALQFHAEVDAQRIEQWLIGHSCELGGANLSPAKIRASAPLAGERLANPARKLLSDWLAALVQYEHGKENSDATPE